MLHHQSFQPSVCSKGHQHALATVSSQRRLLTGRSADPAISQHRVSFSEPQAIPFRLGRSRLSITNREALEALQSCSDEAEKRALREMLVRNNLPLVYAITARMGRTQALPQEDLRQIGSLGLLRAIDAFQPSRGRTLSSFAVPYIRGAIQHELRDRASLMRIPRPLWELRRRATVLQDRRRRLGQPQLAPAQLASALDCPTSEVVEALRVGAVVDMRSLDAPASRDGGEEGCGRTLLDLLPDPASLADGTADGASEPEGRFNVPISAGPTDGPDGQRPDDAQSPASSLALQAPEPPAGSDVQVGRHRIEPQSRSPGGWPTSPELSWLQLRLGGLTAQDRQLLMGHVCQGLSWAELGRELGLQPRQAQRRALKLLHRLEAEARRWRDGEAEPVRPA